VIEMELMSQERTSIVLEGHVTLSRPNYTTPLSAIELAHIKAGEPLAIAAGRNPTTNGITFLLASGELRELANASSLGIPDGAVRPTDHGQTLAVDWYAGDFEIDVGYAIDHSAIIGLDSQER